MFLMLLAMLAAPDGQSATQQPPDTFAECVESLGSNDASCWVLDDAPESDDAGSVDAVSDASLSPEAEWAFTAQEKWRDCVLFGTRALLSNGGVDTSEVVVNAFNSCLQEAEAFRNAAFEADGASSLYHIQMQTALVLVEAYDLAGQ